MSKIATLLVATSLGLASTASAQTLVPQTATPQTAPTTQGGLGGLGGLLGGALPNLGSIGAGNAAGLLGYCLKNNLLGQGRALSGLMGTQGTQLSSTTPATTGARSIFERLAGRQGVQASPGFAAGQAGQVQAPNGRGLSLDNLGGQIKTRMCSVVLNRAKSFL